MVTFLLEEICFKIWTGSLSVLSFGLVPFLFQGWLHRLSEQGTAQTENLLERAVAKSSELMLPVSDETLISRLPVKLHCKNKNVSVDNGKNRQKDVYKN